MRFSSMPRAILIAAGHFVARSMRPGVFERSTFSSPVSTRSAQASESSRNDAGLKIASKMPRSNACCGLSVRFCFSGFEMITSSAFSMPIRFGNRYAPPQPGTMPRKTSGSAMAAAEESIVRYVEFSAISSPPPSARPLTKENDGTPRSASLPRTWCPRCAILSAKSRVESAEMFDRSAPAAKMYGLPVTATASISPLAARAARLSSVSFSSRSVSGPIVFGRL